jgi:hypothetical protein
MIVADREPGIAGSMSRDFAREWMAAAALPLFTRKSTPIFDYFCPILDAVRPNLNELEPKKYPPRVFKRMVNYCPLSLLDFGPAALPCPIGAWTGAASQQVREFASSRFC